MSAIGETEIVCVVAPVDQTYESKPGPASSVTGVPAQTDVGPVIATVGAGAIGIDCEAEPPQPVFVTDTASETLPESAAVKVMALVPAPAMIVPPVMVHV